MEVRRGGRRARKEKKVQVGEGKERYREKGGKRKRTDKGIENI